MDTGSTDFFDARTCEEIGHYVYALIDPRDQKPFYIGKGQGNRVFAHASAALETEYESDKLNLIREIASAGHNVEHVILRHALDEKTALTIESTLLDFSAYFHLEMTNLVLGHHASAFGAMSASEIIRKFNSPPLEELGDGCVIININKRYRETKGTASFYEVTKGYWAMANPEVSGLRYVLAEYQSFIVEVFEVENWYRVPSEGSRRWGFNGRVAPDDVRAAYLNRKIYKKRGTANPISYRLQTSD